MSKNNARRAVIEKGKDVATTYSAAYGKLTACKHANGKDWWILVMEGQASTFHRYPRWQWICSDFLLPKNDKITSRAGIDLQSISSVKSFSTSEAAQYYRNTTKSKYLIAKYLRGVLIVFIC